MQSKSKSPVADFLGKRIAVLMLLGLVALVTYNAGYHSAWERSQASKYDRFAVEVHTIAQMYVGEAKGQPEEWRDLFSAVLNRVDDDRFPGTLERVVKAMAPSGKTCEVNAMCDAVMEIMTSPIGQRALADAHRHLTAYYAGWFKRTHRGHSWATPQAATGHAYFQSLEVVLRREGHWYFGDPSSAPGVARIPPARKVHQMAQQ